MHVASPTSCMYLFSRNLFLKFLFGRKEIPFPYILQISFRFGISFQSYLLLKEIKLYLPVSCQTASIHPFICLQSLVRPRHSVYNQQQMTIKIKPVQPAPLCTDFFSQLSQSKVKWSFFAPVKKGEPVLDSTQSQDTHLLQK